MQAWLRYISAPNFTFLAPIFHNSQFSYFTFCLNKPERKSHILSSYIIVHQFKTSALSVASFAFPSKVRAYAVVQRLQTITHYIPVASEGRFIHSMPCPCRAHDVPLPCRDGKGLECLFPIWFTQCGRVWFTLAMSRPCHALTMPFFSRPQHSTAVSCGIMHPQCCRPLAGNIVGA